jgi:hypothetical protein
MSAGMGQLVHTPFGLVPESKVFSVSRDETVKVMDGRVVKVELGSGRVIAEYGEADSEVGSDPHEYASALREQTDASAAVQAQEATAGYPLNGYYTSDDSITKIQSFSTTWKVSSKPQPGFTYLYLWNGLSGGGLQPVQKWTKGRETHQPWIENWAYVKGVGYVHGPDKDVSSGQEVTGRVQFVGREKDGGYTYKVTFVGHPELDLTVTRPENQGPADGVVQCWETYSDQPTWPLDPKLEMRKIDLTMQAGTSLPSTINWTSSGKHTDTPSGHNIEVVDTSSTNGQVDFYFQ